LGRKTASTISFDVVVAAGEKKGERERERVRERVSERDNVAVDFFCGVSGMLLTSPTCEYIFYIFEVSLILCRGALGPIASIISNKIRQAANRINCN